jgi:hypothetical protein
MSRLIASRTLTGTPRFIGKPMTYTVEVFDNPHEKNPGCRFSVHINGVARRWVASERSAIIQMNRAAIEPWGCQLCFYR